MSRSKNMSRPGTGTLVILLVIGVLAGFTTLPASHAQEFTGKSTQEVSQQDLRMFASAYAKVGEIYTAYESMINNAGDPERAHALQQEANQRMNKAVEDEGLSVPEYNAIYSMVEKDRSLQEQVDQLLEEKQ